MSDDGNALEWLTCEQAGCTDPHCCSGHGRLRMAAAERCAGCKAAFLPGDEVRSVALMPAGRVVVEEGALVAVSLSYHAGHLPGQDEIEALRAEHWPQPARG